MKKLIVPIVTTLLIASPLLAWDSTGHMTVAYIAYKNLSDDTRMRVPRADSRLLVACNS